LKQASLSAKALSNLKEFYEVCETPSKGCLGYPTGCIETFLDQRNSVNPATCDIMLSWSADGEKNSYALTGVPGGDKGYIAMGFSDDAKMV
jgi:hypothetical protein